MPPLGGCSPINDVNCTDVFCGDPTPITATIWCPSPGLCSGVTDEMMDSTRTRIREHRRCPEYAEIFPTNQVNETDKFGNRIQKGSVPVRWFGQDLSRAPDSDIGYSQDHRTRCAGDDWVEQDSGHPMGSQLMGRKR